MAPFSYAIFLLRLLLLQPNPPKQQYYRREEADPDFPPDARLLGHPQHPVHRASELESRVLKLIVHFLSEGGGVADFVADEVRQL